MGERPKLLRSRSIRRALSPCDLRRMQLQTDLRLKTLTANHVPYQRACGPGRPREVIEALLSLDAGRDGIGPF
jgi:hypothetical protein